MKVQDLKIVFMGTPEFAVSSLRQLVEHKLNVVAAVSPPDRPAGRGHKLQASAVKQYAVSQNIPVLQPEKMKDPDFLKLLRSYEADLFIVVAFRMLPKEVWQMPALGTFNLHGSLLPQYRGAAPINRAIMNGESITGVTSFFIDEKIDTGRMLMKATCDIGENETAGELHDRLMQIGAEVVVKTVEKIAEGKLEAQNQEDFYSDASELNDAPKIFKDDCKILWNQDVRVVHNHIRGLSPYPAAWSKLIDTETQKELVVKIFQSRIESDPDINLPFGTIVSDGKSKLKVACNNGYIVILEVQMAGKKRMKTEDFLRGFQFQKNNKFES